MTPPTAAIAVSSAAIIDTAIAGTPHISYHAVAMRTTQQL